MEDPLFCALSFNHTNFGFMSERKFFAEYIQSPYFARFLRLKIFKMQKIMMHSTYGSVKTFF